jgi:CTD small phosphatase-like protein 2
LLIKDISKLGRDLTRTIIIDNVWENFQLQPDNAIFIKTWKGDEDSSLIDLIPFLAEIVVRKVKDVKKIFRNFRDTLIRLFIKGDPNPYETIKKSFINEKNK